VVDSSDEEEEDDKGKILLFVISGCMPGHPRREG